MTKLLNDLKKFQDLLKSDSDDYIELFSQFGILKPQLLVLNNDNIIQLTNEIEKLLEALYDNDPKQKIFIAMRIGTILNEVSKLKNSDSVISSAILGGSAAVAGARLLMKSGPLGMLAAGILGVAGGILLAKENDQRPLDNTGILTIAYYLSMYDHHDLFGKGVSAIKAFEAIGSVINVSHNTLKSRRDCFDSLIPKEKRTNNKRDSTLCQGSQANIAEFKKIIERYKNYNEEKMRERIEEILDNYQKKEVIDR